MSHGLPQDRHRVHKSYGLLVLALWSGLRVMLAAAAVCLSFDAAFRSFDAPAAFEPSLVAIASR